MYAGPLHTLSPLAHQQKHSHARKHAHTHTRTHTHAHRAPDALMHIPLCLLQLVKSACVFMWCAADMQICKVMCVCVFVLEFIQCVHMSHWVLKCECVCECVFDFFLLGRFRAGSPQCFFSCQLWSPSPRNSPLLLPLVISESFPPSFAVVDVLRVLSLPPCVGASPPSP